MDAARGDRLAQVIEAALADPVPGSLEEALAADLAEIPPVIGDIVELVKGLRAIAEGETLVGLARIVVQAGPLPQVPLFNTIVYLVKRGASGAEE